MPVMCRKKFTVEPSVTQTLMNTMQESSDFLTRINIVPVSEMKGEKIGIGVTGSIASTTDTAGGTERQPKDFSRLASNKYECDQITRFYIRYKRWTCGRVIRISSSVSVTPLSNASPLISSWPVLTA